MKSDLSIFLKKQRKTAGLTQIELAEKSGVGLRLIRNLEQGKINSRMDKVNEILKLFGYVLYPTEINKFDLNENR
jgi:y4mF family transcriptional regulator